MLRHINVAAILFLGAVIGCSQASWAQSDAGGYMGAGFGQAMAPDFCSEEPGLILTTCEDKDSAFKLFGGFQFNRNFALEASYFDLGVLPSSGSVFGIPFDLKFEATAFTLQGVGIAPVSDELSIFGKAGLSFWNLDASGTVGGVSGSVSEDGVDIALGLGAQFLISNNMSIRAEWDFFPDFGNDDTGEGDMHMISVGLVFSFR